MMPFAGRGAAAKRPSAAGSSAIFATSGGNSPTAVVQCRRHGDSRRRVPATLLAGAPGDPPPVLDAAVEPFAVDADYAELGVHRHDRAYAELGGLLHDQIHRIGLWQRLHERQIERRLGQCGMLRAQLEHCAAALHCADERVALLAAAVEGDQLVTALQSQHVREIVSFAFVERQRVATQVAVDEQSRCPVLARAHKRDGDAARFARWLLYCAYRRCCGAL